MMIEFKCPCCQKHIQLILSSNGDADVGVPPIKETDIEDINKHTQEELAQELFNQQGILLGEQGGD